MSIHLLLSGTLINKLQESSVSANRLQLQIIIDANEWNMKYAIKRVLRLLQRNNTQWKVMNNAISIKIVFSFVIGCFVVLFLASVPNGSLNTIDEYLASRSAFMRQESYGQCMPKEHIMFLKTHKCGSSTIQNIFLRYGYRKNLTFALPHWGNYFGSPRHFEATMLPKSSSPASGIVDIFCVHTRMEEDELKKILHNDTVWITILRDPVSLYESLFNYFRLSNQYEMELDALASKPLEELANLPRARQGKFGHNQMLYDLGAEPNITVLELQRKLREIDNAFDLVMIVEHIEESLILLKDLLCWTMDDMVAFVKNARRKELKKPLSNEAVEKLRDLNSADVLLYNYFLTKHEEKVLKYGVTKMKREILQLNALISDYFESCVSKVVEGKDDILQFKEYNDMVNTYLLSVNSTEGECFALTLPEMPFISIVREHQISVLSNERSLVNSTRTS